MLLILPCILVQPISKSTRNDAVMAFRESRQKIYGTLTLSLQLLRLSQSFLSISSYRALLMSRITELLVASLDIQAQPHRNTNENENKIPKTRVRQFQERKSK